MSHRMRRVNAILKEAIAEEVADLKDPRLGFVTVTGVETAPNLRRATVYYSVIGSDEVQASTAEALDAAAPRISRSLGPQVRMKFIPSLTFAVDESIERGTRIARLLRDVDDDIPDESQAESQHEAE